MKQPGRLGEGPKESFHHVTPVLMAMRRNAKDFALCALGGVALGVLSIFLTTPTYTASSAIMVDNRQLQALRELRDISTLPETPAIDPADIDSQAEVLHSESVGLAVIRQLKLADEPGFVPPPDWSPFGPRLVSAGNPELEKELSAFKALNRNLVVVHVPHTSIIKVEYSSPSPTKAAEIANAYASAYMDEQLRWRMEANQRARTWLQKQTAELRKLSVEANLAVRKFMADNNLMSTKGTRVSELDFNQMSAQLITEQGAVALAQARYARIKKIIDTHQMDAAVTEALSNPVINELRTKYLDASRRSSDLERKLGPNHNAVVNLRKNMATVKTLLFQELQRIADAYRNDYEIAITRENSLSENLTRQQTLSVAAKENEAQLRQLEQKAESYKTLYQNYLQRDIELSQQESLPVTSAHILTIATPPIERSSPRPGLNLLIATALGLSVGGAWVGYRESRDRSLRTLDQINDELGVEALGMLPRLVESGDEPKGASPLFMRYVAGHPYSGYAETLRTAKVAVDALPAERKTKVIGVVSLCPDEGKTTVAKNFADLLALQGARALLVDADVRNPSLTRALGAEAERDGAPSESSGPWVSGYVRQETGLSLLPTVAVDDAATLREFSPAVLGTLLDDAVGKFDYIVLDLPPIMLSVDARSVASLVDGFIFIALWGQTSRDTIHKVLTNEQLIREKLVGVILNQVDMDKMKLYVNAESDGYYQRYLDPRGDRPGMLVPGDTAR